tara:strand:+ start:75 stop:359 length:285 start_codon:yes stop_codon:yes gene_type:complete
MMQVRQMTGRTGAPVANQFIINDGEHEYFQSYDTVIAKRHKSSRVVTLDAGHWDYSVTTSKYRNQFLGMSTAQVKRDIRAGRIALVNLNDRGQS